MLLHYSPHSICISLSFRIEYEYNEVSFGSRCCCYRGYRCVANLLMDSTFPTEFGMCTFVYVDQGQLGIWKMGSYIFKSLDISFKWQMSRVYSVSAS